MISLKLALRNVRKSFRDYSIYFITLMFGVCIFYVFNSIESQQMMMEISTSKVRSLEVLNRIMGYVSVFISFILGFLIVYANRFLIKRRKKEFGIYQILGMEKRQISKILIIETFLIAMLSLIVGLIFGIFLSQGFAVITASLFDVRLGKFVFIFSSAATIKAIAYFSIAFILVMIFNSISVGREKIINLVYADRKNEKFKAPHILLSVVVFIISVICLAIAYTLIIKNGLFEINSEFWTSIVLGIVGTLLLFFSLSGFFLKVISLNKKVYLRSLNMFVLRQLNSKINTTYVSMTVVCLLLFVSICVLSSGMGISRATMNEINYKSPCDATVYMNKSVMTYDEAGKVNGGHNVYVDIVAEYKSRNVNFDDFAKGYFGAGLYQIDDLIIPMTLSERDVIMHPNTLKLSDYNSMMKLYGRPTISLKSNEFIINCGNESLANNYATAIANMPLEINNTKLVLNSIDPLPLLAVRNNEIFILSDELVGDTAPVVNFMVVNYIQSTQKYEDIFVNAVDNVNSIIRKDKDKDKNNEDTALSYSVTTKMEDFENNRTISVTISYLAIYIGIVFIIISAAILAITLMSEASDNIKRYSLLRKIGTDESMINHSLFTQIAIYFFIPLILAIIHSIVGIKVASSVVAEIGKLNILRDSILTTGIILVIYGGYFVMTYLVSKNIVKKGSDKN